MIILIALAPVSSLALGFTTFRMVDDWYNYRDNYGDREKLEALEWIKRNIPRDKIIVAEEAIARWVEGISGRRVLMLAQPMYLFIEGEVERTMVAKAILISTVSITNGLAWVYEQDSRTYNISTILSLNVKGAFDEFLYLEPNSSYVEAITPSGAVKELLSDASTYSFTYGKDFLRFDYILPSAYLTKIIKLNDKQPHIILEFIVKPHSEEIEIRRVVLDLKKWFSRTFYEIHTLPGGRLKIITDLGDVILETNAEIAFPFVFTRKNNDTINAFISLSAVKPTGRLHETKILNSQEIMRETGAEYIILPKIIDVKPRREIILKPFTRQEYMHLLDNENLSIVYENERVIILRLESRND